VHRSVRIGVLSLLTASLAVPALAQSGADLYKTKCAMCHGADGKAETGAGRAMGAIPFKAPDMVKLTSEQMFAAIKNGKAKMPAYGSQLNDGQIHELVMYIRTLQK